MTQSAFQFDLVIGMILTLLILAIPPVRATFGFLFGSILLPAFLMILQGSTVWILWAVKVMARAHIDSIAHLLRPRSVVFRSLKDEVES